MEKLTYLLFAFAFAGINAVPVDSPTERIANGVTAGNVEFPYAVSIQLATAANLALATRGHICGGVLVTLQHVLTAASCTYTIGVNNVVVPIVANQYRVFAGAASLINDTSVDRVRNIANYTLHPEHIPAPAHLNDIAIMTLVAPFGAATVGPLSLPATNFAPADNTLCSVAGWGAPQYSTALPSSQLLSMTKYIYNQGLCTTLYNSAPFGTNVFNSMVCAASFNILSAGCYGDEGNALVCGNTLTGISFLTDDCQASSYPELYTRVSNYTTWIRSVTGSASTFKPGFIILILFTAFPAIFQKILA